VHYRTQTIFRIVSGYDVMSRKIFNLKKSLLTLPSANKFKVADDLGDGNVLNGG